MKKKLTHRQARQQAREIRAQLSGVLGNYDTARGEKYRRIIKAIRDAQSRLEA